MTNIRAGISDFFSNVGSSVSSKARHVKENYSNMSTKEKVGLVALPLISIAATVATAVFSELRILAPIAGVMALASLIFTAVRFLRAPTAEKPPVAETPASPSGEPVAEEIPAPVETAQPKLSLFQRMRQTTATDVINYGKGTLQSARNFAVEHRKALLLTGGSLVLAGYGFKKFNEMKSGLGVLNDTVFNTSSTPNKRPVFVREVIIPSATSPEQTAVPPMSSEVLRQTLENTHLLPSTPVATPTAAGATESEVIPAAFFKNMKFQSEPSVTPVEEKLVVELVPPPPVKKDEGVKLNLNVLPTGKVDLTIIP